MLFIIFFLVVDGNYIFLFLFRKEGISGFFYIIIMYKMDLGIKILLYFVLFDFWIMKINFNFFRNVIYNRRGEERIWGREERREEEII